MSKRKGVSLDEKKTRMLDIFYEKKEFFQLKDLEKIAYKEKGITVQSVKDVLKDLVDNDLVDSDKIGTSIYFWSFPSKARHAKKQKLNELRTKLEEANKKLKHSREKVIAAKVGREETEKRQKLLHKLHTLKIEEEKINLEIQKYRDSDPETLDKMKREIKTAVEAANRWTDNIFNVKSWTKNKLNIEGEKIDKQFGIPSDFDYLEA